MTHDLIVAGFGGQGVLFAGQLLARAALDAGLETTWYPSYGPEMRGGTANCTVIVSDRPIGAPLVARPSAVIALNLPSLDRFEPLVRPGGLLVVNASLVDRHARRGDVEALEIAADDVAAELGHPRLSAMVLVGAYLARSGMLPLERVRDTLASALPERHHHLLGANAEALRRGAAAAVAQRCSEKNA